MQAEIFVSGGKIAERHSAAGQPLFGGRHLRQSPLHHGCMGFQQRIALNQALGQRRG
jgi:hypothetical protein